MAITVTHCSQDNIRALSKTSEAREDPNPPPILPSLPPQLPQWGCTLHPRSTKSSPLVFPFHFKYQANSKHPSELSTAQPSFLLLGSQMLGIAPGQAASY